MKQTLWLVLLLLLLASPVAADTLRCPYDTGVHGLAHLRAPTLNRPVLSAEILAALGQENPWTPLFEEQAPEGEPQAASVLRLDIELGALPPATSAAILAPLPDGAGCTPVLARAPGTPARAPRFEDGVMTFDHTDGTRALMNPAAFGLPPDAQRPGAVWPPLAWRGEWLAPRLAWAVPVFPHVPNVEDCNVSESPLSRGGAWTSMGTAWDRPLNANGTHCLGGGTGSLSGRYHSSTPGANLDLTLLVGAAGTVDNQILFLFSHLQGPGTATYDAYNCMFVKMAGAANDQLKFFVDTDGAGTQIGANLIQEVADNQGYGCRISNHVATFQYFNGTTWSVVGSRGPPGVTYGAGPIAVGTQNAVQTINQVTWGTLSSPGGIGRYFLGR